MIKCAFGCRYSKPSYPVCTCGNQDRAQEMRDEIARLQNIVESMRQLAENAEEIEYARGRRMPYVSKLVHASDIIDILEGRSS